MKCSHCNRSLHFIKIFPVAHATKIINKKEKVLPFGFKVD